MQENKDRVEDLPIEEFENDNQDFREEFLKKFGDKNDIQKSEQNDLKGGKADNKTVTDIAKLHNVEVKDIVSQLHRGIKVELEHTDDPKQAIEIAMDHLVESPIYYTKLAEMESSFDKK